MGVDTAKNESNVTNTLANIWQHCQKVAQLGLFVEDERCSEVLAHIPVEQLQELLQKNLAPPALRKQIEEHDKSLKKTEESPPLPR